MSLDTLVWETCDTLRGRGLEVSPGVVKATVQIGRHLLQQHEQLRGPDLIDAVVTRLRRERILLSAATTGAILHAYATVYQEMEVLEISDVRT